jgi:hypothetical protein
MIDDSAQEAARRSLDPERRLPGENLESEVRGEAAQWAIVLDTTYPAPTECRSQAGQNSLSRSIGRLLAVAKDRSTASPWPGRTLHR